MINRTLSWKVDEFTSTFRIGHLYRATYRMLPHGLSCIYGHVHSKGHMHSTLMGSSWHTYKSSSLWHNLSLSFSFFFPFSISLLFINTCSLYSYILQFSFLSSSDFTSALLSLPLSLSFSLVTDCCVIIPLSLSFSLVTDCCVINLFYSYVYISTLSYFSPSLSLSVPSFRLLLFCKLPFPCDSVMHMKTW